MANLSKYYNDILLESKASCVKLVHPGITCKQFHCTNVPMMLLGTAKFFFPLYFLPLIAKPRNITKKKLRDVLMIFINSVQTAFLSAFTILFVICLQCKWPGTITYWRLFPLSSTLGGWSIFFASKKVKSIFGHAAATVIIEILIRDGYMLPLKLLNYSKVLRTLAFMSCSATVLDTLYVLNDSAFWLFQPLKSGTSNDVPETSRTSKIIEMIASSEKHICHHNSACDTHIAKVFKNFLILGVALEAAKALSSNFALICRAPKSGLKYALGHVNMEFLYFLCGYPTLTRLTNCLLNRWSQRSTRLNQGVAAFFGGIPFYLVSSELSLLSHTAVTAIELLWMRYEQCGDPKSKTYSLLMKVPFVHLVYMFGGAFMYSSRVFYPWLAPKFLVRLMDLLTNHKFDEICQRLHSIWIPHELTSSIQL